MKRYVLICFLMSIELNIGFSEVIELPKPNIIIESTVIRLKRQCNIPETLEFNRKLVTKYSSTILNRIEYLNANIRIRHRSGKELLRNSIQKRI